MQSGDDRSEISATPERPENGGSGCIKTTTCGEQYVHTCIVIEDMQETAKTREAEKHTFPCYTSTSSSSRQRVIQTLYLCSSIKKIIVNVMVVIELHRPTPLHLHILCLFTRLSCQGRRKYSTRFPRGAVAANHSNWLANFRHKAVK